jgi:dTMP kinase
MTNKQKGMFIVLEGVDAAGKTTNFPYVQQLLEEKGMEVIRTREPGGTKLGEEIRNLLLGTYMCPKAELLLFAAARAQHVEEVIKPAVARGAVVLCDRYLMSTYAYQGYGRGFKELLHTVELIAHNNYYADHTLFFNVSFDESRRRVRARTDNNRIDVEADEFFRKVHQGYQDAIAMHLVPNLHEIDANLGLDQVRVQIKDWVDNKLYPDYLRRQMKYQADSLMTGAGGQELGINRFLAQETKA